MFPCSADHEQDWQPYPADLYSVICDDHTYIHNRYCNVYPQLPPVIGSPRGCCGHASGISLPRPLWFGGCAPHATPCYGYVPGYSHCTLRCLTSYNAAILASFFLFACLQGASVWFGRTGTKIRTATNKKHASRRPNLLRTLLGQEAFRFFSKQ